MKRLITLITLLLFVQLHSTAQYLEVGGIVGSSNYLGDLQTRVLRPAKYHLGIGIYGRYNLSRYVSFKAQLLKGEISGDDSKARSRTGWRERNLNFRSDIIELSVQGELNLMRYDIRDGKISAPYLFAGIGGFYFNPKAEMHGNWYELQPLGTEGQSLQMDSYEKKYSRYQFAIPFGIGFKFNINNRSNFGLEFGFRKTFTDYLDDVSGAYPDLDMLAEQDPIAARLSYRMPEYYQEPLPNPMGEQRGDGHPTDWYFFGGLSISVNLTDKYGLEFDERYKPFSFDYQERLAAKAARVEKREARKQRRLERKQQRIQARLDRMEEKASVQAQDAATD